MARYSDDNYGSYSSPEDARRSFEESQHQSIKTLADFSTVHEKDGKYTYLGMNVPPELAGTLQYVTSTFPTYITDLLGEGVYKNSKHVFEKLNDRFKVSADPLASHNAGLKATAALSAVLIGVQPITEVISSIRQRGKDRKQIKEVLSSVIEMNKGSYKNNEVIMTAMEHAHNTMITGFMRAAAEMPTVLLNGYYASESHKELAREKTNALLGDMPPESNSYKEYLRQQVKKQEEIDKAHNALKGEYGDSEAFRKVMAEDYERRKNSLSAEFDSGKSKDTDEKNKFLFVNIAGGANIFLKHMVSKGRDSDHPSAYELILDLQQRINNGDISKGSDITGQIIEIFQQNERDRKRPPLGDVFMEKFTPIAERIGEVISKRELDAIALVNLVGEGKIVNKRNFVEMKHLEEIIDTQRSVLSSHQKTPLDEFLSDFQNPKMVIQIVKSNLKALDGDSKALFASMFSDEVLKGAGVSKKELLPLRARGHDFMCEFIKSTTVELAKKTDEELKSKGLSDKQIDAIKNLNELIVSGDDKGVKSAIGSGGEIVSAVRNAGLNEQLSNGSDMFWREKITPKKLPAAAEKPKASTTTERVAASRENPAALSV